MGFRCTARGSFTDFPMGLSWQRESLFPLTLVDTMQQKRLAKLPTPTHIKQFSTKRKRMARCGCFYYSSNFFISFSFNFFESPGFKSCIAKFPILTRFRRFTSKPIASHILRICRFRPSVKTNRSKV